ncbi:zinc-ribbon domain-containing protein [Curtobacterium sp. MCSS17_008]|uniref:zinc-ribbon domain-containing protein n=1 Tax=Curtobacterium sp. MCSS17_008 TaxID=2175647 RepID=UPI000DA79A7F|nr:zinc-ribbon domain-containing protein [Curtobacterium sp. MCSS17_008]PZF56137.1 zinc-ribbon domain-containing protein [Curtobacterium sp. MCSS17_008]
MFLIFGTRGTETLLTVVRFVCGVCGVHAAQRVVRRTTTLSLFFVPLVPLSRSYRNECVNCGAVTRLTAEQADRAQAWAAEHPGA